MSPKATPAGAASIESEPDGAERSHRGTIRELGLLVVVAIAFVALAVSNENFLTQGNLTATALGMTPLLIVSIGMTIALISGGFDLSVGGVVALTPVSVIYLMNKGMAFGVALTAGVIAALLIGLLNGLLISRVRINPLITTLGTLGISRGIAEVLSQGTVLGPTTIGGIPSWFTSIGTGSVGGVPTLLIGALVLVVVGDMLLRRGRFFREVYFLGGSERAARFAGINVPRTQMSVYIICSLLSAIAGLTLLARFGSASSTYGTGYELQAIAAAVIGGAALSGGVGSLAGTFIAAVLLALVQDAIVLYSVSVYWQGLITGLILVVAVAVTLHGQRGGALAELLGAMRRKRA